MIRLTGKGIWKHYGATRALDGLDLDISSGEIVGIAGPNGAGKSTLVRLLAGEEKADGGEIRLIRPDGASGEIQGRVAVVHQEPHIWPNMTVEQNLAVGREGRWFGRIGLDRRVVNSVLTRLGIAAYAQYALADLSLAIQQRVEIARTMLSDVDVYLFDEPNSALTDPESAALFTTMDQLARHGKIVLLITHRLSDFVRHCNRVLVLRDGRMRGEIAGDRLSEAAIAAELTASVLTPSAAEPVPRMPVNRKPPDGPVAPLLRLNRYSDRLGSFRDISLELMPGRIVALSGVEGSGARELAQAIGGFRAARGADGNNHTPVNGTAVAYLAASRCHTVFHTMNVGENFAIRLDLRALGRMKLLLDPRKIASLAEKNIIRYRVKTGGAGHPITSLSGGNQQKVVLGAAMEHNKDIIVIEEPTRGVDIASKADIYELLRDYARRGRSVVVFCTEAQEIFDIADEVLILSKGRIVGQVDMTPIDQITTLSAILARFETSPDGAKPLEHQYGAKPLEHPISLAALPTPLAGA